jgi:hypothetical protein
MPLFSRKPADDPSARPDSADFAPEGDFVASNAVVARVSELMVLFNLAVGNTDLLYKTATDIAAAAGLNDRTILGDGHETALQIADRLRRPWRMLEAVAAKAAADGDSILAGRVFSFVFFWFHQIQPIMDSGQSILINMDPQMPRSTLLSIAQSALAPLGSLPGDCVIFSNQTGTLTAGGEARSAALTILDEHQNGAAVPAESLAAARDTLGYSQPAGQPQGEKTGQGKIALVQYRVDIERGDFYPVYDGMDYDASIVVSGQTDDAVQFTVTLRDGRKGEFSIESSPDNEGGFKICSAMFGIALRASGSL